MFWDIRQINKDKDESEFKIGWWMPFLRIGIMRPHVSGAGAFGGSQMLFNIGNQKQSKL